MARRGTGEMPVRTVLLLSIIVVQTGWSQIQSPGQPLQSPSRRFEYKHSFKPPYLAQKDGTVPFFEYSGNAIASQESVRITPSLRSQKGSIWGRLVTTFDWWEVEIQFRVTGRGKIGADGLAFWYTATKGFEGPVFGSSDRWVGLGVFFDSFDNDNKHNNPYIMAMTNDGEQNYDHQKDGSTQQLAGCLRDFRNKPFAVRAKIEYYMNVLTVRFHNGMSSSDKDFEVCMRVENVFLPKNGFFGLSAATGGLADDHDVMKFEVYSLRTASDAPSQVSEGADSEKIEEEFREYQKKLDEQKEKWVKEHPDEATKFEEEDYDNYFNENEKELQQIFQAQEAMRELLRGLNEKMDSVVSKQDGAMNAIATLSRGGTVQTQQGGQVAGVDTIRREEVNAILANQREIVGAVRDIKNFVSDIHSKTGQILNKPSGSAQPVGGAYDVQNSIREIRDSVNSARHEFQQASQRMAQPAGGGCDLSKVSCVSTTVLIAVILVQLAVLISYLMYRDSKEQQAKKFY